MNALAEFIVKGRWQAVLVATVCGVMTFMLPPFSTMLNYVAAAAVATLSIIARPSGPEWTTRSTEDIVRELWLAVFGRKDDDEQREGKAGAPNGATTAG